MKTLVIVAILLTVTTASYAQTKHGSSPPQPVPTPPVVPANGIKLDAKGVFAGSHYSNALLGLTFDLPAGWELQDSDTGAQFAARATEKGAEAGQGRPAAQASLARTTLLFLLVRPTQTATNPSVVVLSEDIALVFNVRTPEQYLMGMRKQAGAAPLSFDSYTTNEKINGVDFAWMGAVPKNPNLALGQRYYVTIRNHHAIGLVMTFHSEAELNACLEVLNALKFK
jgi:hypothetical protein